MGVDLYPERARECGVDGADVALPVAACRLSLAMDSQLGRAHCHQHVSLSVFGVVGTHILNSLRETKDAPSTGSSSTVMWGLEELLQTLCFSRAFWASSMVRNLKTPRG